MNPEPERRPSTIPEFARRYGVTPTAVHDWGRRGLLRITRLGPRTLRVMPHDEERWLKVRQAMTPPLPIDAAVVAQAEAQAKAEAQAQAQRRSEELAALAAKANGTDGINRLGLSPYLLRRLAGIGVYCLRDLEDHPRRRLLPAILGVGSLRELRAVLEDHGLGLSEAGDLYTLIEEAA